MHHLNETAGTLTLMGSGEMSPGMAETHRRIMRQIEGDVRAAFIDTPAGFELNVSGICEKAREYFRENFDLDLAIASFPNASQATPLTMEAALKVLRASNYIFSGPGSPTYAVRNWRGTPIFETMAGKLASGSQLVLASAATLSVGVTPVQCMKSTRLAKRHTGWMGWICWGATDWSWQLCRTGTTPVATTTTPRVVSSARLVSKCYMHCCQRPRLCLA